MKSTLPLGRVEIAKRFRGGDQVRLQLLYGGAALIASAAFAYAADLSPVAPGAKGVPPSWAYPLNTPGAAAQPAQNDTTPHHVPGSNLALTAAQIAGRDGVPDWRPNGHPPMPEIVAKGRPPAVRACG